MEKTVLSVSSLNQYIKNLIEGDAKLCNVIVQGEVTNLTKHYTGHYYFSVKDENSKVSCMMFSYNVKNLKFDIKNGDLVLICGYISLYEKTGTYQLYARTMEPYGLGQELLKIEALKRKLKEEGVFDLPKKEIPPFPSKIALVTSSVGAAVHDLIHTIQSRWNTEIDIFPCLVQGKDAPESIIKALIQADNYGVDTIIIGRGGGANEDLSAFNDEGVVRTIIGCNTPIISAIGHQIDSSISDMVSDFACITPTEAGIKATPDRNQILENVLGNKEYISTLIENKIDHYKAKYLEITSSKGMIPPSDRLRLQLSEIDKIRNNLNHYINVLLESYRSEENTLKARLNSLNPYGVLSKGYSLVYSKNKKIISSVDEINLNDEIEIELKDGSFRAYVDEITKEK